MPQVEPVRTKSPKVAIIAAVAGVLVVALIVAGVFWSKSQTPDTKAATKTVLNSAADKAFGGDYDAAIADLQQQLPVAKTNEEKLNLYMSIGANYENKHDNKSALAAYQKAGAIAASYGTNDAIARTAERSGNKSLALTYQQKNRALVKSGQAPHHQGDLPDIEAAITRLGGTL